MVLWVLETVARITGLCRCALFARTQVDREVQLRGGIGGLSQFVPVVTTHDEGWLVGR